MTDRELLELAAKAAGIKVYWCELNKCHWLADESDSFVPLDNDGDALRLAVKLHFAVSVCIDYTVILGVFDKEKQIKESHENDRYAATRRAIVRAAAEIGKEMK